MASVRIEIDAGKLKRAVNESEGLATAIDKHVQRIAANANAMSAGYRTGVFYDRTKGKRVGNTQPIFDGNTQRRGDSIVGLVYTGNYAAQKHNLENNTLLKSI